jgi:hypothetical protein
MPSETDIGALVRPRTSEGLLAFVILLLLVTAAAAMPAQNDTWWNLATGRHIVEHGAVQLVDPFSWTAGGRYWSNHEWLSQVLFYLAYRTGGMPGLMLLGMLLVGSMLLVLWLAMSGPPLLRGLLLLALATLLVTEWSLRPKLFTLLAVTLTLKLLVDTQYRWLPVVFLLWANLHGAVALGVVILSAACLEALVHDRNRLGRLVAATAVSVASTACTPLGFSLLDDVVLSLQRPDYAFITEWQPLGREAWTLGVVPLAGAVAALAWHYHRALSARERLLLYVAALLLPLAIRYSRNIPIFTLAAGPLLSTLLVRSDAVRNLFRSSRPRATPLVGPVAATLAIAAAIVAYVATTRPSTLGWDPLPPAAIDAIRRCGQPMYNHFDIGGHLIWFVPEQPVFIDSRQHPYPATFVVDHFRAEGTGNYQATFTRYGIACAVLPPSSKVAAALVRDGWQVEYTNHDWLILVPPS